MKRFRYWCASCRSLVTTPKPYAGPHYVALVPYGFVPLPCPGKLVQTDKTIEELSRRPRRAAAAPPAGG